MATALDLLAGLQARLDVLRHRLLPVARSLTGARVLASRLYGITGNRIAFCVAWDGRVARRVPRHA